ncbi:MAG: serine/threonine-protein kinase, partial [Acidobacteriota bacterium]
LKTRLLREARALAQLQHPGICEVYRVGEEAGRPFVAMRLIDGEEIDVALADASWRTIVAVMRDAADAVAAAHAAGLVHRDLKPPNILVETAPDGGLRPVVVDFGLVQDRRRGTRLTVAGELLGTPHYMAPEQLRGAPDAIGPATDVWALGITLAQLLSDGQTMPFEGDTELDLMRAILVGAPHLPDVGPPALHQVLRRCLAKSSVDRYADARALARDLDCVLSDRPLVRPTIRTRLTQVGRRLHTQPVVIVAGAIVLLGVLLIAALELRHRAHLASARNYGQLGKDLVWTMRAESMQPPHSLTPTITRLQARIAALERDLAAAHRGSAAWGPLHYAIGEGYRALGEMHYDRAETHLAAAWASGFRTPDAAYARGVVLSALYHRQSPRLRLHEDPEARPRVRRTIRQMLERASPSVASPAYVEALVAYSDRDWPRALNAALRARATTPWAHEVERLIGDIHGQRGVTVDLDRSETIWREASAAYARAIAAAPSDPVAYLSDCELAAFRVINLIFAGHGSDDAHAQQAQRLRDSGRARCETARQLDPTRDTSPAVLAMLEHQYAEYQLWRLRRDPTPQLMRALRWAWTGLDALPKSGRLHGVAGDIYRVLGAFVREPDHATLRADLPRSPDVYWDLASMHYRRAQQLQPDRPDHRRALAVLLTARTVADIEDGRDPTVRSAHALDAIARASRPTDVATIRALLQVSAFQAWHSRALWAVRTGGALGPALGGMRRALRAGGQALTHTSWDLELFAQFYGFQATLLWAHAGDPRPALAQQGDWIQRAHRLDPGRPELALRAAQQQLRMMRAQILMRGVDPGAIDATAFYRAILRDVDALIDATEASPRVQRAIRHHRAQLRTLAALLAGTPPPRVPLDDLSALPAAKTRARHALMFGLGARARGDAAELRHWRAILRTTTAARSSASHAQAEWAIVDLGRSMLERAAGGEARGDCAADQALHRAIDEALQTNPWLREDATVLRYVLARQMPVRGDCGDRQPLDPMRL